MGQPTEMDNSVIGLAQRPELAAEIQSLLAEIAALTRVRGVAVRLTLADGSGDAVAGTGSLRTDAPDAPDATDATAAAAATEHGRRARGRWLRRERGREVTESIVITGRSGDLLGHLLLDIDPDRNDPDNVTGRRGSDLLRVFAGHIAAVVERAELTDRVSQLGHELRAQQEDLRSTTRAFWMAFEESVVGMAMISLHEPTAGRFLRVNDALCRLTGYSAAELTERTFSDITHPDDRGLDESALRRAMAGRRTPFQGEKRYLRADGTEIWVQVTAASLFDDDGRPLYALTQVADLSARRGHEDQVAARQDSLTGLLNESALDQTLSDVVERARRHGTSCAVLVAEIDGLDELVSQYGGAAGDQLQVAVARQPGHTLRTSDVISRVGNNRFVIVTEETGVAQAKIVASRLGESLAFRETIAGHEVHTRANLGVAILGTGTSDTTDSKDLLSQAEAAVIRARTTGGTYVLYSRPEVSMPQSHLLYANPDWPINSSTQNG